MQNVLQHRKSYLEVTARLATSMKLKLYNTASYQYSCWAISKTDAHGIDALDQW